MDQRDDERPATTNLMQSVRPPAPAEEERPATEQQPSILAGSIWEAKLAENQRVTTVDIKQFLSYNKEVYEKNIMDDYREQAVLRALNRQRLQTCRLRNLETFRASNEQRRQFEASVGNPFVWRKQRLELEAQMMEEALKHERPAFSDLEELEPLMQASKMKQRGLRLPNPMAAILSPRDMMRMHEARVKVPDLGSLMNPRNQMTSPVPDKQQLLASLGCAAGHHHPPPRATQGRALLHRRRRRSPITPPPHPVRVCCCCLPRAASPPRSACAAGRWRSCWSLCPACASRCRPSSPRRRCSAARASR